MYGPLLRKARLRAGYTLLEIAEALECSESFVLLVEKELRVPAHGRLTELCQFLGIDPAPLEQEIGERLVERWRRT